MTGDRPEAWTYGPVFARLAEALAGFGSGPIAPGWGLQRAFASELDAFEHDLVFRVCEVTEVVSMEVLSAITRGEGSPWERVYAGGRGLKRDIPHLLIADQFRALQRSRAVAEFNYVLLGTSGA